MEDQILKLIQDIGNNGENIGPEQELLESGILDSLAFITLLEEIAVRWRIEIQPTQDVYKRQSQRENQSHPVWMKTLCSCTNRSKTFI